MAVRSRGCRVVAEGKRRRRGRIALQSWPTAFAVLVDKGQAEGRNRVVEQFEVCRWAREAGWTQSCTQSVRTMVGKDC